MQIPDYIFDRINEVLADKSLSRDLRDRKLEEAAVEAWHAIFPEGSHRLSEAAIMQRWEEVNTRLSRFQNRDQIMRIIESQASGERFHWLDSPTIG